MSERIRLTHVPLCGRVVDWKGQYGWIEPQCFVDHPEMNKHQGHIFAHSEDLLPRWTKLTVGSLVEFHLYFDGQGLGAEECVARKVLRLTLPWELAQSAFGENGENLPELEVRHQVSVRAYQWKLMDGSPGGLPFVLLEVWGRPQAIVRAVVEATGKDLHASASMLVPESRLWKLDVDELRQRCRGTQLQHEVALTDPMRCHALEITGTREEVGAALQALIAQVCD
eukprot:CAMPEP_0203963650 /NCGR_PEP_ID=MMETSP0359-20131031/93556_1 /ASSEMBLY_ACC=CAM_ASM_000338 /TAXON_ID=268821 /ORGANISM="Scrippsiella Hangoei, Strain SHTV-5" /LENGTH=225 /DNA_ID=CAMNT_0050899607 /DNA_START=45 /DNA_END=722 /DNA_ORIENTATION=+